MPIGAAVRTATGTTAYHATFFPQDLAEYQHASGVDEIASLASGFQTLAQTDLVTLRDALNTHPRECTMFDMPVPASDDAPASNTQIFLGPTARYGPPLTEAEGEHCFYPCCLFMNSFEAFKPLLGSTEFRGFRFYAARNPDGTFAADCHVNGQDFPEALPWLMRYAERWGVSFGSSIW